MPLGLPNTPVVRYGGGLLLFLVAFGALTALVVPRGAVPAIAPEPAHATDSAAPIVSRPTPLDHVLAATDFRDALKRAWPYMGDSVDDQNQGAALLALWIGTKGERRLQEVVPPEDFTTVKKAEKDSGAERGKRLCVTGRVADIHREKGVQARVYSGLLTTPSDDHVSFLVGGSTGELVEGSRARLCGVFTGEYAFSNVSGGQTRSVQIVGMFDLKENR